MDTHVYVHIHTHFTDLSADRAKKQGHTLVTKHSLGHSKKPRLFGEMANSTTRAG